MKKLLGKEVRIKLAIERYLYGIFENFIPKGIVGNKEDIIEIISRENIIQLFKNYVLIIEENI